MLAIARAAVDGVSARRAVARALTDPQLAPVLSAPLHVVAAGKAASAMATALREASHLDVKMLLAIGTHRAADMPASVEWMEAAHPIPDARSVAGATRALEIAQQVARDECLLLLLSGGASALMAAPGEGLTLSSKQQIIREMMLGGADIHALNVVRKHASAVKGGRLAAECRGHTVTLAVSDVVGDDLSVIGSGPGVPDATTVDEARDVLQRFAPQFAHAPLSETPKPHDPSMARVRAVVIASRQHAIESARSAAERLGYHVETISDPVTGEAREAAAAWFSRASRLTRRSPACVLSAGETTVRVVGRGRGGRNQEFALALASALARESSQTIAASIGTDGIDGPTDAAGALVDETTQARAAMLGMDAHAFLAHNNAYEFFANLGDLIHFGRTETNVGDLQILLTSS